MEDKTLFSEQQRFKQIWLWILLLGINGFFFFGLIKQLIFGEKLGNRPMSNGGLVITTLLILLISILVISTRLDTVIKTDGMYVRLFPIQWTFRFYSWDKLQQLYVRQYSPIGEYGGWGFRGFRSNRALNISGDKGIQLIMRDGTKLLIGTQKADEVREILRKLGRLTTT